MTDDKPARTSFSISQLHSRPEVHAFLTFLHFNGFSAINDFYTFDDISPCRYCIDLVCIAGVASTVLTANNTCVGGSSGFGTSAHGITFWILDLYMIYLDLNYGKFLSIGDLVVH